MNDAPRQTIVQILAQHGNAVIDDVRRCEGLLRDLCGEHRKEINILVTALKENVVASLLAKRHSVPPAVLIAGQAKIFHENCGIAEDLARWGVESWALALGIIDANTPLAALRQSPSTPVPAPVVKPPGVDIELPACFYLGREYDLEKKKVLETPVMYEARDLCTHGIAVGMTGSGKTGLCISLLEEAAIDGIPCIIIDPKGDLTNLLLQFPDLSAAEFQKWVNPEDAHNKKMSLEDYAAQVAGKWREGLQKSGQSAERIRRLQQSSDWRIYTPGSEAGLPVAVLKTFAAPAGKVTAEDRNQKINAVTTALLGLAGIEGDPLQSREHILVAQLLLHAWSKGKSIDLHELIAQIQAPPLDRIGAFDVETFYPEKDRIKLAVALNNILAAPWFGTWIAGEALDLAQMLYKDDKPRQLIFYIAHLEDAQRMFFVTLLLEEVLTWTRKQPGTTNLRAIVYFDEVFGYLPPHPANPPTKLPLMTLLKQARAFGVGILLATQNPVDLDYKALSNAGTWFVGKLQTERDKARLVEGLEGVAAERGTLGNRAYLETVISALGNRVFLLHNVHRGKPVLFQTRHALSFLRGPMTRDQVALLMEPFKEAKEAPAETAKPTPAAIPLCRQCHVELPANAQVCPHCGASLTAAAAVAEDREFKQTLQRTATAVPVALRGSRPALPDDVPQVFLPLTPGRASGGGALVYVLRLLGMAEVAFVEKRRDLVVRQPFHLLVPAPPAGQVVAWHLAEKIAPQFAGGPAPSAQWSDVPDFVGTARKLKSLEKTLANFLYDDARLTLFENSRFALMGQAGEDLLAFRERCRQTARQKADDLIAAERRKYEPRFHALGVRVPERPTVPQGTSVLDVINPLWWFGVGGSSPLSGEAARLEREWFEKQAAIYEQMRRCGDEYTQISLSPRRQDVQVAQIALAWVPVWR